jgi:hypothetical protein
LIHCQEFPLAGSLVSQMDLIGKQPGAIDCADPCPNLSFHIQPVRRLIITENHGGGSRQQIGNAAHYQAQCLADLGEIVSTEQVQGIRNQI